MQCNAMQADVGATFWVFCRKKNTHRAAAAAAATALLDRVMSETAYRAWSAVLDF